MTTLVVSSPVLAPAASSSVPDPVTMLLRRYDAPPLLTAEEERTLSQQLSAGDSTAAERLVVANLRLVLYVAKGYTGRGLPLEDLVQEGTLGLMTAAQRFDYTRGYRFGTYAIWWIRQSITRAIAEQSRTIRLPIHVCALLSRASNAEQRLVQRLGRTPTPDEIAAEIDVPLARLAEIWRHRSTIASLDRQVGEDGAPLADFIPSSAAGPEGDGSPEDTLLHHHEAEAIRALIDTLTPRERVVIRHRFGFTEASVGPCATLAEVADLLKLSRERIRQIERLALAKLRHRALHGRHRRALVS